MRAPRSRRHATIPIVQTTITSLHRAVGLVLVVLTAVVLAACGSAGTVTAPATAAVALAPASPVSGLATMVVAALPQEGIDTLRLIASGGPFPYPKDGVTFSNREGILPAHPSGWYHEYTVITPGSSDRGARRIIAGKDGGRFYTDDHYASFREVLSGVST
jgi:ribonuclease T1